MPHILKSELPDILAIAQRIADHCLDKGPVFDTAINFATSPLIATRHVKLGCSMGRVDDLGAYRADSSIKLFIPTHGWAQLKRKGSSAPIAVTVLIASAIAHELVHERQEIDDATAYDKVVDEQRAFDQDVDHTAREWFDGYYHTAHEREAHATQAAVALWAEAHLQGLPLSAAAGPLDSEAFRRPRERMLAPGKAGNQDIDGWWDEVLRLANLDIVAFS